MFYVHTGTSKAWKGVQALFIYENVYIQIYAPQHLHIVTTASIQLRAECEQLQHHNVACRKVLLRLMAEVKSR